MLCFLVLRTHFYSLTAKAVFPFVIINLRIIAYYLSHVNQFLLHFSRGVSKRLMFSMKATLKYPGSIIHNIICIHYRCSVASASVL